MRKDFRMHFVLCVLIVLAAACKKNNNVAEQLAEAPVTPVTPPVSTTPPPVTIPSYEVGTGSGYLTIDGKSLDLSAVKLIKVKAGTYKGIYIKNIIATAASPVTVRNVGQVFVTEGMETENINYVNISGDGDASITFGFSFENVAFRAIKMSGKMTGVVLNKLNFKNVGDYCIAGEANNGNALKYTGSAESRTDNFKILNCSFENTGPVIFGGNLNKDSGEDTGFFKDVEVAYNVFKNSPSLGSAIIFTNVQDYNIHHN
ncbi:MAG: hypothetical protein EOO93_12125, partial [Pedobacter sp.]